MLNSKSKMKMKMKSKTVFKSKSKTSGRSIQDLNGRDRLGHNEADRMPKDLLAPKDPARSTVHRGLEEARIRVVPLKTILETILDPMSPQVNLDLTMMRLEVQMSPSTANLSTRKKKKWPRKSMTL